MAKQCLAVTGACPGVGRAGELAGAVLPPVGKLPANRRQLRLRVDEAVAVADRQLVLVAHRDGVDGADLRAETAVEAAPGAQDEFAQLPVPFLRRNDVHFEAGRRADTGTEAA